MFSQPCNRSGLVGRPQGTHPTRSHLIVEVVGGNEASTRFASAKAKSLEDLLERAKPCGERIPLHDDCPRFLAKLAQGTLHPASRS